MRKVYITVRPESDSSDEFFTELKDFPSKCPLCHISIEPIFIDGYLINENDYSNAELVFKCTSKECEQLFIALYHRYENYYFEIDTYPKNIQSIDFEFEIHEISDSFVRIYNEAHKAEQHKLKEIAGVGYRKALEFLIKDYLINHIKIDRSNIEKTPLGACINNFINQQHIKSVAERAAWLGNDETHYVRKWEEKDINDLKGLISLTVNWIAMEIKTNNLINEMEPRR